MRHAVCIFVTLLLVSLPGSEAFAQTSPEASPTSNAPLAAHAAFQAGVSALPPSTPSLWVPIAGDSAGVLEELPLDPTPVRGWSDWSTEKRVWIVGGVVVGLLVLGIVSIG